MPRRARVPLPTRNGLGPTKIVLGKSRVNLPLIQALSEHSRIPDTELREQFDHHNIVDIDGVPLPADYLVTGIIPVFVYREPRPEVTVPYEIKILYQNERFMVVDKPHFLSTIPRGMHITQTALIRLRQLTGNDALSPAHRLDRLTAGLLLFTCQQRFRGAYQQLFAQGKTRKYYKALASVPHSGEVFPQQVSTRIEKTPGIMRAYHCAGAPNAHTTIEFERTHPSGHGQYHLIPATGKTHQLRMHMWHIGHPIIGDPLYPVDLMSDSHDFSVPLHLRADGLEFTDPFTGEEFAFRSTLDWILS